MKVNSSFLILIFFVISTASATRMKTTITTECLDSKCVAEESDLETKFYYFKYGNVPIYDTVWCKISAESRFEAYHNAFKEGMQYVYRNRPVEKDEFEQAKNKLILKYIMHAAEFKNFFDKMKDKDVWSMTATGRLEFEFTCSDPDYSSKGSRITYQTGPSNIHRSLAEKACYGKIVNALRSDFYFILPVECTLDTVIEKKGGKLELVLTDLPPFIKTKTGEFTALYNSDSFKYSNCRMDLNQVLTFKALDIKWNKQSKVYYLKLNKKMSKLARELIESDRLMIVSQKRYYH